MRSSDRRRRRLGVVRIDRQARRAGVGCAPVCGARRQTMPSEMDSKEQRAALRAAVYRGDGHAVVDLLGGVGGYKNSLQLAGDGLIAALMQHVDGARELARDLTVGLCRR